MDHILTNEIICLLKAKGADIIRFTDISSISADQRQGFKNAIIFCLPLSREFIIVKHNNLETKGDEFSEKEHEADELADRLAEYICEKGYIAYSQSTENNWQNNNFNVETKSIRLPLKTISRLAGIGYIGKNNLLITDKYGCALTLGSVLTDAPVVTENYPLVSSQCGKCDICKLVCAQNAIFGDEWTESTGREGVIDVFKCDCSLNCMINCPKTLKYAIQET